MDGNQAFQNYNGQSTSQYQIPSQQMTQHQINQQIIQQQLANQAMIGRQTGHQDSMLQGGMPMEDPNSNLTRHYRKKKTWSMTLKISIETPELDHKLDESFEIEIGSN